MLSLASKQYTTSETKRIFWDPIAGNPNLFPSFTLLKFVKRKANLYNLSMTDFILKHAPSCGIPPSGKLSITDRCVQVDDVGFHLEYCWDEIRNTFFEEDANTGNNRPDLGGKLITQLLEQGVVDRLPDNISNIAFWANTENPDPDLNMFDGLWTLFEAEESAGNIEAHVTAPTGTPSTSDAADYIEALYAAASVELKMFAAMGQATITTTFKVVDAIKKYLRTTNALNVSKQFEVRNGALYFNGNIPIIPMPTWDAFLASGKFTGTPTTANYAVFTIPKNLIIGSDVSVPSTGFKRWYNVETEKNHIQGRFLMGAEMIHPKLVVIGY